MSAQVERARDLLEVAARLYVHACETGGPRLVDVRRLLLVKVAETYVHAVREDTAAKEGP